MKIIARCGKYELLKDKNGIYYHCYCGGHLIYGYERNESEAINRFAKRIHVPIENIIIL